MKGIFKPREEDGDIVLDGRTGEGKSLLGGLYLDKARVYTKRHLAELRKEPGAKNYVAVCFRRKDLKDEKPSIVLYGDTREELQARIRKEYRQSNRFHIELISEELIKKAMERFESLREARQNTM